MINLIAPIIISLYGDSTMLGLECATPSTCHVTKNNVAYYLQDYIGDKAIINSDAFIGGTIKDLINGTGMFKEPFNDAIRKDNANVVIANFGINDSHLYNGAEYTYYLNQFIDIARANNKIPILEEPNPICSSWSKQLDQFVIALDTVAKKRHVPVIAQYSYIRSIPAWQVFLGDCIHAKDHTLYAYKAMIEFRYLQSFL